jgi:hypothetical protein
MPLQIISIRKLARGQFDVAFSVGKNDFHSLATLSPKRGNAVKFHDQNARKALIRSGRHARVLCDLVLAVHKGRRPKLPCVTTDKLPDNKHLSPLTAPASEMLEVG